MTDKSLEESFCLEQSIWGEIVAEKLEKRDIHFTAGQGAGGYYVEMAPSSKKGNVWSLFLTFIYSLIVDTINKNLE